MSQNLGIESPKRDTHQWTLASVMVTDVSLTGQLEKTVCIVKGGKKGDRIKKFGEVPNQPVILSNSGGRKEWFIFSQILVDSFAL